MNQLSLLRSPWLHFACAIEYFLLTLTLSLREREQQASGWCFADGYWANSGTGVIDRRWIILPLSSGEGWGEGEPSVAHPTVQSVVVMSANTATGNYLRLTWTGG